MHKSTFALVALALAPLGVQQQRNQVFLQFKEEAMTIEYTPAVDEAVVIVEAETEHSLNRVDIRTPAGAPLFKLQAQSGQALSLQGFVLETRESSVRSLFEAYAEGLYDIRGRTTDGSTVLGSAAFSLDLLPEPVVLFPFQGAINVPTSGLEVSWVPDANASGYRIALEQDENDGIIIDVPASRSSLQIPDGILAPHTKTQLEIGALAPNGNCTLLEVYFTTL